MRLSALLSVLLVACTPDLASETTDANDPVETTSPSSDDATLLPHRDLLRTGGFENFGPITDAETVWSVTHDWDDVTAEEGLAWGANSGLTWDEKYRAWIDAMDSTSSVDGNLTAELVTPWGRALPLNRLECAESAIVLRATFAAWHGLPFYMSGYSPTLGRNVYYGHFGMMTSDGVDVPWAPNFANWTDHTADYAGLDDATILATWPDDTTLEGLALTAQQDDHNSFLGADAYSGAYFDEVHLNKRVGHFLLRVLTDFGSIHLAHATNVFDIDADAIETGDVLIHRWQAQGTGHTMVIKEVVDQPGGTLDVNLLAGNMPRVQPRWQGEGLSMGYFTHRNAGSAETHPTTGDLYVDYGGGLKRWRSAEQINGRWSNIVPMSDRSVWIDPDDTTALTDRIDDFEILLGESTPEDQRDALLLAIDEARVNLAAHPSSCANRERRERAFDDLYVVMETEFGWTRGQVDATYRELSDYVFAELEYTASPSCCWNSSTPAMHDLILEYAESELADAEAAGTCVEPTIFRMRDGGYEPFATYAASVGQAGDWVAWSADEACPQADATDGIVVSEPFTAWCDLETEAACEPVAEMCDGIDNDCDGEIDEVCPVDDGDDPIDEGGSAEDCGCGSSSSMWWTAFAAVGIVLPRRRRTLSPWPRLR